MAKKNVQNRGRTSCPDLPGLGLCVTAVRTLYKGFAVGTFRYSRIALVGTNRNAVQAAVLFGAQIMLALCDGTMNARIFHFVFHDFVPHF